MLEFGDRKDFDDPRLEYRRLFSELLGTFFLVLVAAGGGVLHAKGQISLAAAVVAPGLMVLAIILFMGAVSGAHLNPACRWPSRCAATFRGSGCRATSSCSCSARRWRACSCWRCLATSSTSARPCPARLPRLAGVADGDRADRAAAQRDPRYRLGGPERRRDRRARGRRLYRAGRAVGGAGQRGLDEPGALVRPGAGERRLDAYWVYVAGPLAGAAIAVGCAISCAVAVGIRSPTRPGLACSPQGTWRRRPNSPWRSTKGRSPRPESTRRAETAARNFFFFFFFFFLALFL